MPDGGVKDVPLGELAVEDKVRIKPGEKIPADGVIVKGESAANEAMLTGESTPVTKKTGGKVIGGAINGEGSLTIEVTGTAKDSFLSPVIDLVKQAQKSKSKTQDLANTAALWLTICCAGWRRDHSPCSARRTRWRDVLLLLRRLSAKVSVHARRCQAPG